jgi:hypothetical protein
VGLVFVGYELRQNTAMMRGSTMQAISDKYVDYVTALVEDVPADLMRRVHDGETTEDFTPLENTQINILTPRSEEYWRNRSSPHVASPDFVKFLEARVQIGPGGP